MCRLILWVVDGVAAVEAKNCSEHNGDADVLNEWGKSCTYDWVKD